MPSRTKPRGFRFPGGRNAAAPAATSGFTLPTPLPFTERATAFWRAGNYAGSGPLLDLTGNGHDLDINGPTFLNDETDAYVYLPAVAGNWLSVPDEAALRVTGDIDIRWHGSLDDWTPGADKVLLSKWHVGTAWIFRVTAAGALQFGWFDSGSRTATSTALTGITDGATKWVRITRATATGDVNFYLSDDGDTWAPLGDTVPSTGSAINGGTGQAIGVGAYDAGTAQLLPGKFKRAIVKSGIDGTTVLDIDASAATASASTFTATTGQTVTINRSTTGRKAVVVEPGRPVFLFGTDDYMEAADHADLDFGQTESFTVAAAFRQFGTAANFVLTKTANLSGLDAGYGLYRWTDGEGYARIADAAGFVNTNAATVSAGAVTLLSGVRSVARDSLEAVANTTVAAAVTDTTSATLSNAVALRIGTDITAGTFSDMEFIGAAIFREALTAEDLRLLQAELTS